MLEDYTDALAAATDAALAAGDLLRDEFYRPSGPLGSGGRCEADLWAERIIRERLLGTFPDWAFRGEETGYRTGARGERHLWLVDPNDGTAAFLRGMRGASISIGLLRDDEPVLGVVFAFAASDGRGDLLTWAEGCGPLRRQGLTVTPAPWPSRLERSHVVLLSPDAERSPRESLTCVAPARFRTVPSIAYRLALAAAGESVAAVSLDDPAPWSYAAGHALLRAVGGDLVGEDGRAIGYSQQGSTYARYCFGGAPAVVRELSRRQWDHAQSGAALPHPPLELPYPVRPEPGRMIADQGVLSRARGSLMGQLCGDALGGMVEFESESALRSRYPAGLRLLEDGGRWGTMAGQPTDDSELALALSRSLVTHGSYDPNAVALAYAYWHRSDPFDEGGTTRKALGAIRDERRPAQSAAAAADRTSQANGSLMRVSPLGIFGHRMSLDEVAELARADSAMTHPHPACQEACAIYVVAISRAIAGGGTGEEVYKEVKRWASSSCRDESVMRAAEEAVTNRPADYRKNQGWVLTAVQNAFYQLLHAPNPEEGIVSTVMAGGDTDTNASIAGALLGAVYGYETIPSRWRNMVLSCRPVEKLAPTRHPRPYPFWPTDATDLAERLAALAPTQAKSG